MLSPSNSRLMLSNRAKSKAGVVDEPTALAAASAKGVARAVLAFKEDRQRFMPGLSAFIEGQDALPTEEGACAAKLYLPSELPVEVRAECPTPVRLEADA